MSLRNAIIVLGALLIVTFLPTLTKAQSNTFDEDQLGAWYMYFWSLKIKESGFGFQGDIQFRNWDLGGDLEQLLLRGGLTYTPENANIKFTLGYAYILSGEFGESTETSGESRIYQEALLPQKVGGRAYLTHRLRYEQRWVEGQDFRTRFRYALFINAAQNWLGYDTQTLVNLFFPEIRHWKKPVSGVESLISIDNAHQLIGFEPVHSPDTFFEESTQ